MSRSRTPAIVHEPVSDIRFVGDVESRKVAELKILTGVIGNFIHLPNIRFIHGVRQSSLDLTVPKVSNLFHGSANKI